MAFAALVLCTSANAQDPQPQPVQNQTISSSIEGRRYEILTSGIPEHKRYRIDKETGNVWMFYSASIGYTEIKRQASDQDIAEPGKINYQLYIMGDGSNAYLMNLNTGVIWYYEWHIFKDDEFLVLKY